MKGSPGGLCPPGFGLSFLLVHPLLRRVASAPVRLSSSLAKSCNASAPISTGVEPSIVAVSLICFKRDDNLMRCCAKRREKSSSLH